MDLYNWKNVKLSDVAKWERVKKDYIYPKGTTIIQVSAASGQVILLPEASALESKYAAIIPDTEKIEPEYLYYILEKNMPEFLHSYQSGININPDIFKFMRIDIHIDLQTQREIVNILNDLRSQVERTKEEIETLKEIKQYHLRKMFT